MSLPPNRQQCDRGLPLALAALVASWRVRSQYFALQSRGTLSLMYAGVLEFVGIRKSTDLWP